MIESIKEISIIDTIRDLHEDYQVFCRFIDEQNNYEEIKFAQRVLIQKKYIEQARWNIISRSFEALIYAFGHSIEKYILGKIDIKTGVIKGNIYDAIVSPEMGRMYRRCGISYLLGENEYIIKDNTWVYEVTKDEITINELDDEFEICGIVGIKLGGQMSAG